MELKKVNLGLGTSKEVGMVMVTKWNEARYETNWDSVYLKWWSVLRWASRETRRLARNAPAH